MIINLGGMEFEIKPPPPWAAAFMDSVRSDYQPERIPIVFQADDYWDDVVGRLSEEDQVVIRRLMEDDE